MDIKEAQEKAWKVIEDFNKKHNLNHNKNTTFLHLVEEVGELSREIYNEHNPWRGEIPDREKIPKEIIDVLAQCLVLAKDYEVDIESVFNKKIVEWRKRFELN